MQEVLQALANRGTTVIDGGGRHDGHGWSIWAIALIIFAIIIIFFIAIIFLAVMLKGRHRGNGAESLGFFEAHRSKCDNDTKFLDLKGEMGNDKIEAEIRDVKNFVVNEAEKTREQVASVKELALKAENDRKDDKIRSLEFALYSGKPCNG